MRGRRQGILALLAGDDPSGPMAFAVLAGEGSGAEAAPLAQGVLTADQRGGAPAARPSRTILILPASLGRLTRAALPARTDEQARAAARFLLESSLATDGAGLHYAVGAAQNAEGDRLLAAIDPALLQRFLDRCRQHGAEPFIVVFDCAALQPAPGEAKAVEGGDRLVIGAGAQGGLSLESALARTVAPRWLQSLPEQVRRIVYVGPDAAALQDAVGPSIEVRRAPLAPTLEVLARDALAAKETAPNLRQGTFAAGAGGQARAGRGWKLAGFLAAAAILSHAAAQAVAGFRDGQEAIAVEAQTQAQLRTLDPALAEGADLGPALAALSNSLQRAAPHPILSVSEALTETLRAAPEARLDSLTYEAGASRIRAVVSSPAPSALAAVVAALQAKGLDVMVSPGASSLVRASQTLEIAAPSPAQQEEGREGP